MAITVTAEHYTFAVHASSADVVSSSFTPAANSLLLYAMFCTNSITDITGHEGGGDWIPIFDEEMEPSRRLVVWACITGASPTAGTVTISKPYLWNHSGTLIEFAGVDTAGYVEECFGTRPPIDAGYDVRLHEVELPPFRDAGNTTLHFYALGGGNIASFPPQPRSWTLAGEAGDQGAIGVGIYEGERRIPRYKGPAYTSSGYTACELKATVPAVNPEQYIGPSYPFAIGRTVDDNAARGSVITPTEDGVLNSVWARLVREGDDTDTVQAFLYEATTGALMDSSTQRTDIGLAPEAWYEFTGFTYKLRKGYTYYVLVAATATGTGTIRIAFEQTSFSDLPFKGVSSIQPQFPDLNDPPDPVVMAASLETFAVYAEYTPVAPRTTQHSTDLGTTIIKKPWTKQPPAGTPIDWDNPITEGLVFAGPREDGSNIVLGSNLSGPGTLRSTAKLNYPTINGRALNNIDNDNGGLEWTDQQLIDDDSPITILGLCNPAADAVAGSSLLSVGDGAANASGLFLNVSETGATSSGQFCFLIASTGGNILSGASPAAAINGEWRTFVGQGEPGTVNRTKLWVNGVSIPLDTSTSGDTSGWSVSTLSTGLWHLGERTPDGDPIGSLPLALAWRRLLTEAEVYKVSANPWQIFKPQKIYLADKPNLKLGVR
jgi:hypothetical protein